MINKRYLDKVIEHLVRGTKIDYEKEEIHIPFYPNYHHPFSLKTGHPLCLYDLLCSFFFSLPFHIRFENYCEKHFGLTILEIRFVKEEYFKNIDEKINAPA